MPSGAAGPSLVGWDVLDRGVETGVKLYRSPDNTLYTHDVTTGERTRVDPSGGITEGWGDVTREQIEELESAPESAAGGIEAMTPELERAAKMDLATAVRNRQIDPGRSTKIADDLAERFGEGVMRGFPAYARIRELQDTGQLPKSPDQIMEERRATFSFGIRNSVNE